MRVVFNRRAAYSATVESRCDFAISRRHVVHKQVLSALIVSAVLCIAGPALADVHPGDQIFVTVYGHPELTGPFDVNAADQVSLPLAGTISVAGMDTQQIARRIQLALDPFVIKPAVDVQLKTQPDTIFVAGGPGGVLKFQPGETLAAALVDLPVEGRPATTTDATSRSADALTPLETSRIDLRRVGAA
jgi:protein involved in polysaccharide export with SLBB domain